MRVGRTVALAVLVFGSPLAAQQDSAPGDPWAAALALHDQNRLADALPLFALWNEALRRDSTTWVRYALDRMVKTAFLTKSQLRFGRWLLEPAPANGLVLTAGDLDTYPLVALQTLEGLRTDVVVVNMPMLDLAWYARRVAREHRLPLPLADSAVATYVPADTTQPYLGEMIVRYWRARAAAGTLGRPLRLSVTTGEPAPRPGAIRLGGAFYTVVGTADSAGYDTEQTRLALVGLRGDDWTGPRLAAADRSPVRRAATVHSGLIPLYLAAGLTTVYAEQGRRSEAETWLAWCRAFAAEAALAPALANQVIAPAAARVAQLRGG